MAEIKGDDEIQERSEAGLGIVSSENNEAIPARVRARACVGSLERD